MAKRFTDTDKWKDDWFISLSNDYKIIWQWLLDNCSHSGLCKRSTGLMNMMCRSSVTEMEMIKELASDEAAYRSLTLSWFQHSPLLEIVKKIAAAGMKLIITTDHGTVKVDNPVRIVGEKSTNTNLRYKVGRGLSYNEKQVFVVRNPQDAFLPKQKMSSEFVFAGDSDFFVYPNNYNQFVNYYQNTFQHGGVSMAEMLIPYIELGSK